MATNIQGLLVFAGLMCNGCWLAAQTANSALVSFNVPRRDFQAGDGATYVATADLNSDGIPDLVTVNGSNSGAVDVLLGKADHTFRPAVSYPVDLFPEAVAIGDFNQDGNLDIVTSNLGETESGSISILFGNGRGGFGPANTIPVQTDGGIIRVADLNGDGNPDLVVVNNARDVFVLLGNGNGTFKSAMKTALPIGNAVDVTLADFNHDGKLDFVTANFRESGLTVALGNGDGTFQPPTVIATNIEPQNVVVGDFNNDGNPDIVATTLTMSKVLLLSGNGDGTFAGPMIVANAGLAGPVVGDFNGDGNLDLAGANSESGATVYLGNGSGQFQASGSFPMQASMLVANDFNNDGKLDLASAAGVFGDTVSVIFNRGNGTFVEAPSYALAPGAVSYSFAVGDLNGDGTLDVVTSNGNSIPTGTNTIGVLLGNGKGGFKSSGTFATGTNPNAVVLADFNGDGRLDAATANYGSSNVSVLFGRGNGAFAAPINTTVPNEPITLAAGDFNGDHRADLLVGGRNGLSYLAGKGNGTFAAPTQLASGLVLQVIPADFNHDGKLDFVANLELSILIAPGNGDGTFGNEQTFSFNGNVESIAIGDFNGDGNLDIAAAFASEIGASISIFLGNGDGTFQLSSTIDSPVAAPILSAADLNGSVSSDLIAAFENTVAVLVNNGDATFQTPLFYDGGYSASSVMARDVTGDGRPDVLVGDTGAITVLTNETGK